MKKILTSLVLGISLFIGNAFATLPTMTSATVWGEIKSNGPSNTEIRRCSIIIVEGSTGFVVGTSNISSLLYYSATVSPITIGETYGWFAICPDGTKIDPVGPGNFQLFNGLVKEVNGTASYE